MGESMEEIPPGYAQSRKTRGRGWEEARVRSSGDGLGAIPGSTRTPQQSGEPQATIQEGEVGARPTSRRRGDTRPEKRLLDSGRNCLPRDSDLTQLPA